MNMNHKIQIGNLAELEKQERESIHLRRALFSGNKAIDVANYHPYDEVDYFLKKLSKRIINIYF